MLDAAVAVRPGEELDLERLLPVLREHIDGLDGPVELRQFPGGASNLTYLLRCGDRELVLRRPPPGTKARSAHDVLREARIMQRLAPVFPKVPKVLLCCDDHSVIGCDFYVMERLRGIILRRDLPPGMTLDAQQTRALCRNVIDTLIELHGVDWQAAGLADIGRGAGYVRRQVEGWIERYERARTWNVLPMRRVRRFLLEHMPEQEHLCVVHNDFRFDNVVLAPDDPLRVIGVLDWEMATIGDALMELGCMLAYWVEPGDDRFAQWSRRQPTHLPGMFTRAELVDYYLQRTGLPRTDLLFYEVFGLFRLAVIAQQIYYRYHHGQSRNPAFRRLWIAVNYLGWRCHRLLRAADA